jgi:hypothetical protein
MKTKDYSILKAMADFRGNKESPQPDPNPCLLVLLGSALTLARDVRWPMAGFTIGEEKYYDASFGDWTGFYDWLRDAEGGLLGVRYTPFEQTEFLTRELENLHYVKADPPRHLEIYFSKRREIDPKRSCDQAFLYDAVFRSDKGSYAIGFGMEELNESDLRGLETIGAGWAVASPL